MTATVVFLSGCHHTAYKKRADRETNRILLGKVGKVQNVDWNSVDITLPEPATLEGLGVNSKTAEYLGRIAQEEKNATVLKLDDALDFAIHYNRDYLNQKEAIFLQALDLTLTRHTFAPIFSGGGDITRESDARNGDVTTVIPPEDPAAAVELAQAIAAQSRAQSALETAIALGDVDAAEAARSDLAAASRIADNPNPRALSTEITTIVAENTVTRNQRIGVTKLTKIGTRIAADFTGDFLKFVLGDRQVNNSQLAVSALQPIMRGGGSLVTMEALTQRERDLLYSLRDFSNFRREFIVGIVSDYYNVLRARDQVQNNWITYDGFVTIVEQEKALAEEDRRTFTEIGQLRQALLNAESRWVNAIADYRSQLDSLKITLGLPVDSNVVLDYSELNQLIIEEPGITRNNAVKVALATRPDLVTSKDQIDDAERGIKVAKNGLLPGLDVQVNYDAISDPGDVTPSINFERERMSATLDVDLPFDRKADRNTYRASLVAFDQAKRADELARDNVKLQIYNDWRALELAQQNYQIAELGVTLAQERIRELEIRKENGDVEARDLVDARVDLVNAQNQRTATLVTHTLARLRLWQDMGVLYINDDGSWITRLESEGRNNNE